MFTTQRLPNGSALGGWWQPAEEGRIQCDLCPRHCRLNEGDRGFCFVRANRGGQMVLETYGRSTGFCIDPIEKKPLNHFLPGTPVLSFGTAGCNLGCKFCQNWDISKSREVARLSDLAEPDDIADAAMRSGCRSVAFTYNDPVIWAEYAIDVANACRQRGIKTVAVTAGYITEAARRPFFAAMDAANVDLKAFTEDFYHKITASHLQPVLDTLKYLREETSVWFEITNLVIPGLNDGDAEFREMTDWCMKHLGPDVPLHFSAFHPDWRMRDRPPTPVETLESAYAIARDAGLRYVYLGNVHHHEKQTTYCPGCARPVIVRDWYEIHAYHLNGDRCSFCQSEVAGRFEKEPGNWGRRRLPIQIVQPTKASTLSQLPILAFAPERPDMDATQPTAAKKPTGTESGAIDSASLQRLAEFAATEVVRAVLGPKRLPATTLPPELAQRATHGVFVTLKRDGSLRGCCGSIGCEQEMASCITSAAKRTALEDARFPPVTAAEIPFLTLDLSVLGFPETVPGPASERAKQIVVGTHGLKILEEGKGGLLLPSVPVEQGWNAEQFLEGLCRKAGLPHSAWKRETAMLQAFTAQGARRALSEYREICERPNDRSPFQSLDVQGLTRWCQENVRAVHSGATPAYYALNLSDGTVGGIVMEVEDLHSGRKQTLFKLSPRAGLPLQTTLFEFSQHAAQNLQQVRASQWELRLMLMDQPMLIGPLRELSSEVSSVGSTDKQKKLLHLEGVDPQQHALVMSDGNVTAIAMDRTTEDPQTLVDACRNQERFAGAQTQLFAWKMNTSLDRMLVGSSPSAVTGPTVRMPAVAGTFYPAADAARDRLVDECLQDLPAVEKISVLAAMTPHAGLKYSGRLAADVWRRIALPKSVLVIGPKHTAHGVNWAVAPHETWQLSPQCTFSNDVPLARALAQHVSGMQLDAAAHALEHGIEIQLPLLARLAPGVKVAAIAMGRGTIEQLDQASTELAQLLRSLPEPPLLVISSDMNHFATDAETRRRDRLALERLAANDARGLLQVCQAEQISMCGQIPAALVLMTLEKLGQRPTFKSIGYATSGDVTGELSRVVGYAGAIWL